MGKLRRLAVLPDEKADRLVLLIGKVRRVLPALFLVVAAGKILLNEVRRKARHCKNLLQRAAQEMCVNDALNQKYAPAFLDASYQLEALEGKTAEGWDAARGVTIAFPRLAAVKDSDGGEMKARMKSLWDNCKETVKGFAEIFSASSDEAVEDLRTMAPSASSVPPGVRWS